jgi:recombination protein RecA
MEKEQKKDANKEANKEKLKALQLTIDKIDKDYGKGTIMRMGENQPTMYLLLPLGL